MANKNYIHPAQKRQEEHEKRKNKKKKKRGLLWLLLLLLLLLGIGLGLGLGLGWFDGKGDGDGDGDGKTTISAVEGNDSTASTAEDSSATEKTSVKLKISGDKYVYDGSELSLEDLKTKLSELDKTKTVIEVTDDGAVANAVTALKEMLDSIGLPFTGIT